MGKTFALLVLLLSAVARAEPPAYIIESLDVLAGADIEVRALNDQGQMIATSSEAGGGERGWLFDAGVFYPIDDLIDDGNHYVPQAINNLGQIVLRGASDHWLYDDGSISPLSLDPSLYVVTAMNDRGAIVGAVRGARYEERSYMPYIYDAFVYANGEITHLYEGQAPAGDDPEGTNIGSVATDINNNGVVVGQFYIFDDGLPVEAFFYKDGKYTVYGSAEDQFESVPKVNNADLAIASYFRDAETAYVVKTYQPDKSPPALWQAGNERDFADDLYGRYNVYDKKVRDLNDANMSIGNLDGDFRSNNEAFGCSSEFGSGEHAFIADGITAYNLKSRVLNGREWTALSPQLINNAGWIVGTGYTKTRGRDTFLLRPQTVSANLTVFNAGMMAGQARGELLSSVSLFTTSELAGDPFNVDAAEIDARSLHFVPGDSRIVRGSVRLVDLDGDSDPDLRLRVRLGQTDLRTVTQSLMMTGLTRDGLPIASPVVSPTFIGADVLSLPLTGITDLYPVSWGSLAYDFGCPTAGPQLALFSAPSYFSSGRPVLRYDISRLPSAGGFGAATLVIPLPYARPDNLNIDVYTYTGDRSLGLDEWDAGELAGSVILPQGSDWRAATVDITAAVRAAVKQGFSTVAVRLQLDPNTRGALSAYGHSGLENPSRINGIPGMPVIRFESRRN